MSLDEYRKAAPGLSGGALLERAYKSAWLAMNGHGTEFDEKVCLLLIKEQMDLGRGGKPGDEKNAEEREAFRKLDRMLGEYTVPEVKAPELPVDDIGPRSAGVLARGAGKRFLERSEEAQDD